MVGGGRVWGRVRDGMRVPGEEREHWVGQEGGGGFFFNDTATTEIYTLSLHDALPIYNYPIALLNVATNIDTQRAARGALPPRPGSEIGRAHV